jgi:LmbE family N-acetylglucosaminyl deacetylase
MLNCNFEKVKNLLFLGAHSDDIEIGCGGTILKLAKANPDLNIRWVVFSADGKRRLEAQAGAQLFLKGIARSKVVVKRFKTSFFPAQIAPVKSFFETLKRSFQPDIVFTHYREDRHQDHRLVSDLTWNTFRDHLILEYEIPKYDGDLGLPNLFVPLEETLGRRKAEYLAKVFRTQSDKHWFSKETFLGLMRLRGVECATRYAEAFHCRKMICGF